MAAEKLSSAKAEISPNGGLKMTIRLEKPASEAETARISSEWVTEKRGSGVGKLVLKRRNVTATGKGVSPEVLHNVACTKPSPTSCNILRLSFGSNASDRTIAAQIKNCHPYESVSLPLDEVPSGSEMSPACHLQPSPKDSGIDISSPPRDDGHLSGVLLENESHDDEGTSSTPTESASNTCRPISNVRTTDSLSGERLGDKSDFFDVLNCSTKWTSSSKVQSTLRTKAERCAQKVLTKTVEKPSVVSHKLSKLNDGTNSWTVSSNKSSILNRKRKASFIDESATYNLTSSPSDHLNKIVHRERVVLRLKQGKPEKCADSEDQTTKKKVKIEGNAGTKLRFKCYSRMPKANKQQYFVEVAGEAEKQKVLTVSHQVKPSKKDSSRQKTTAEIQCKAVLPSLKCRLKPLVLNKVLRSSSDVALKPSLSAVPGEQLMKAEKVNLQSHKDQHKDGRPSKRRRSNKLKAELSPDLEPGSQFDRIKLEKTAGDETVDIVNSDCQKVVKSSSVTILGVETVSREMPSARNEEDRPICAKIVETVEADKQVSVSEMFKQKVIPENKTSIDIVSDIVLNDNDRSTFSIKSCELSSIHLTHRKSKKKTVIEKQSITTLPSLKCKLKPLVATKIWNDSSDSSPKPIIPAGLREPSTKKSGTLNTHSNKDQNHDSRPSKKRHSNKLKMVSSSDLEIEACSEVGNHQLEEILRDDTIPNGCYDEAVDSLSVIVFDHKAISRETLSVGNNETVENLRIADNGVPAHVVVLDMDNMSEVSEQEVISRNETSIELVPEAAIRVNDRTVSGMECSNPTSPCHEHCNPVDNELLYCHQDTNLEKTVSALSENEMRCVDTNTDFSEQIFSSNCSNVEFEGDTHFDEHSPVLISTLCVVEPPQLNVDCISLPRSTLLTDQHRQKYLNLSDLNSFEHSMSMAASEPETLRETLPVCDEALSVETCLEAEDCHSTKSDSFVSNISPQLVFTTSQSSATLFLQTVPNNFSKVNDLEQTLTAISSNAPISSTSSFSKEFAGLVSNRLDIGNEPSDTSSVDVEMTNDSVVLPTQSIDEESWLGEQAGSDTNERNQKIGSTSQKSRRNTCRRRKVVSDVRQKITSCSRCNVCLNNRKVPTKHIDVDRCMSGHRRLVNLRHKVCDFVDAVFPTIKYPKGFLRDSSSVERFIDKIVRVLHSIEDANTECDSSSCSEPFVDICSSPDMCANNLQDKALRLISAVLPDIDVSDIADNETFEVFLELLTSLNQQTALNGKSNAGFMNLSQSVPLHTSSLLSSLPGACVSLDVFSPQHLTPQSLTPILFGSSAKAAAVSSPVVNKKALKRQVKNCLMFLDMELT